MYAQVPAQPENGLHTSPRLLASAVAHIAAWRAADASSLAGDVGSVVVSGLFFWGDPTPAPELLVDGQRLVLAATGRAVGLRGTPLGLPRVVLSHVAFRMHPLGGGDSYFLCTAASPRSLRVVEALAKPCGAVPCTNLVLGSATRCWLHET